MPTRPPRPLKAIKGEREFRRPSGFISFLDGVLSLALVLMILSAAVALWLKDSFEARGPLAAATAVVVPKGAQALEIAERLERSGVVSDRRLFMLQYYSARLQSLASAGDRASLKAGEYQFEPGASVRQVLDTIVSGRGVLLKLTIPEGLTSQQIVERLRAEAGLTGDIAQIPPEGSLLPDTYKFARGASRQEIIDRMQAEHTKLLASLWTSRQEGLPVQTPEQAVVLASIVEKETGKADERPRVASVFVNRLRKGMRLQSDPTIIYGLVGGQGQLGRGITRADIESKTAYNTYQIDGLPPAPICNPGRAALTATLNPASTEDLFFVADGTGGHTFTSTLKDHNAAVANWRRIERSRQSAGTSAAPVAEAAAPAAEPQAPAPAAAAAPAPKAPAKAPALINANKSSVTSVPAVKRKEPPKASKEQKKAP
ncbi:MAG: endolytic transglycosylase MltG [Hyphomicrobiaceae bacterium]|nr:endolytic transglycosylase MltG [Hyphomicrobiaceae bacterium]